MGEVLDALSGALPFFFVAMDFFPFFPLTMKGQSILPGSGHRMKQSNPAQL